MSFVLVITQDCHLKGNKYYFNKLSEYLLSNISVKEFCKLMLTKQDIPTRHMEVHSEEPNLNLRTEAQMPFFE